MSGRESRGGFAGGLLASLVVLSIFLWSAAHRPLWYDELFTFYVSRLNSAAAVVRALMSGADNGPPLDYLARHLSLRVFGDTLLALRLPSVLGWALTVVAVLGITRERFRASPAWIGVATMLLTTASYHATQARGYSSLLTCMAVALWAWQRAAARPRDRGAVLLLGLASFAAPLVNYYGVLNLLPLVAAEVVYQRRRPGWSARTVALMLSTTSFFLLPPFARNAWSMREHFWATTRGVSTVAWSYSSLLGWSAVVLAGLLSLRAVAGSRVSAREDDANPGLRSALLAAIGVLLLVPLVLYAMAQGFTHAMAHRYAVITTLGVGLTAAWLGEGLPSRRRWLRWTVMGALWVAALVHVGAMAWRPGIEEVDTASLHRLIHGHEEMAVDSPKLYLRLSRELAPEDFAKLVYLEDATRAIERMGFDTDELALQRIQPLAGLRLRPFEPTVARAKSLTLLTGRSRGWLRDELKGRGYRLREVESAGPYIVWKAVPQRP